ncbi:glycosyltransferase family 2 protein [Alteromonas sp. Cnat2-8]|uniref:glycosyltransferase n=1 Tax=Alteromonas sp. Cnat2-8 TaxID=2917728 RepID=UPI001EF670FC|nr:glycosyltransferase family A protein [Alteromonas sp. Cnat2-8]MCG7654955.1 glycosyltransferase family 2 protein [Alteromonas sp. Cnat2-8]
MAKPLVSVIIPVYNDEKRIIDCVTSVYEQNQLNFSLEVIVVDNGSTDNTLEVIERELKTKYEDLVVETCEVPGSYAARNKGLSVCNGDFTAFTDSDCIVSNNWVEANLTQIKGKEVTTIIAGEVNFFKEKGKFTEQSAIDFESTFSMKQDENAKNGKCITANFFCDKKFFDSVGEFNSKLKSGGDVEISQRAVRKGGKVVFNPQASVNHPSRNVHELIVKRKRIIGGNWETNLKSSTVLDRVAFLTRLLKMFLGRGKSVLFNSNLTLRRKVDLTYLLFQIWVTSNIEFFRLLLGKEANRS